MMSAIPKKMRVSKVAEMQRFRVISRPITMTKFCPTWDYSPDGCFGAESVL
jgi:hypothetical protein